MRKGPQSQVGPPIKVFPLLEGGYQTGTTVGTTATAIPATNLTNRCGILIQNLDGSNGIFISAAKPVDYKDKTYEWTESGTANEFYLQLENAGGDPSLSETLKLYATTAEATAESEATNGTVGSLTAGQWDWGDNDSLGYNTVYVCTDGTNPNRYFFAILGYDRMPATSGATVGFYLEKAGNGNNNSIYIPLSGNTRIFAIGEDTGMTVGTVEFEPGGDKGI